MSKSSFSNQTLQELRDCFFSFTQINMTIEKGLYLQEIICKRYY